MLNLVIFSAGMFFGILTLQTSLHASKSGIEHTHSLNALIHLGSTLSIYALFAWGFINLIWWIPIVLLAGLFAVLGLVVRHSNVSLLFRAIPVTGACTIIITIGAWLKWAFE